MSLLWILLSLLFFAAGEAASKHWSEHTDRYWYAVLAVFTYIICEIPWLIALKEKSHLTSLGTLWSIGAVVVTILVGMVWFKETITLKQEIGLGLALVACWFLS